MEEAGCSRRKCCSNEIAGISSETDCRKFTVYDCFWQERGSSSRAHSGQSKQSSRHSGTHSMDVDEAPPASDADVCIPAASSSARRASAPVSGCELLSKLSHCFHLFVCVCALLDRFDKLTANILGSFQLFFPSSLIFSSSRLLCVLHECSPDLVTSVNPHFGSSTGPR